MHGIVDDIRQQLGIQRYDINDDTSLTMTQSRGPVENGVDVDIDRYIDPNRYIRRDDTDAELGLSNTMETSIKSKASKVSSEPSADTYNFKSTEDDDVYSTIRSDMNNTANLNGTQTLKSYEACIDELDELEEGEIPEEPRKLGVVTVRELPAEDNRSVSERKSDIEEEYEEDEYEDDEYEDDGDDETDDDQHTTERTATYRTDNDDEF